MIFSIRLLFVLSMKHNPEYFQNNIQMAPAITIRNYTLRSEDYHQIMDANELHGLTINITFHHDQNQLIMLESYRTVQIYLLCFSVLIVWCCSSHKLA